MNPVSGIHWPAMLASTPYIVALLGQVMVLGSGRDFPLRAEGRPFNFTKIKAPDSFRATLRQIGADAQAAFQNADLNMRAVSNYLKEIPARAKEANEMIQSMEPELLPSVIEVPLNAIKKYSESCLKNLKETDEKFNDVLSLLNEVLMAAESKQGAEESRIREVEHVLADLNANHAYLQEFEKNLGAQMSESKADLDKSKAAYETAMSKIPSSWDLIGQQVVKELIGIYKRAADVGLDMLGAYMAKNINGSSQQQGGNNPQEPQQFQQQTYMAVRKIEVVLDSCVSTAHNLISAIKEYQTKSLGQTADAPGLQQMAESILNLVKDDFDRRLNDAKVAINVEPFKTSAVSEVQMLKDAIEKLVKTNATDLEKTSTEVSLQLQQLQISSSKLSAQGTVYAPLEGNPDAKMANETGSDGRSAEERTAEMRMKMVELREKHWETLFNTHKEVSLNLSAIVGRIAKLDLETVDLNEVIQILKDVIPELNTLKQNWQILTYFFAYLAKETDTLVYTALAEFSEYANKIKNDTALAKSSFLLNLLSCKEYKIVETSQGLYLVTSAYADISSKHILPRINGMSGYLTGSDDKAQQTALLAQIGENGTIANNEITEILEKERATFAARMASAKEAAKKNLEDAKNAAKSTFFLK